MSNDTIKDKGFITFDPLEVPLKTPSDYYVKSLIKEAGGPVTGSTKLSYINGYEIYEETNLATKRIMVGWRLAND